MNIRELAWRSRFRWNSNQNAWTLPSPVSAFTNAL